jgi:RNA polymerase sigma-70 factor (ECF subfamily)
LQEKLLASENPFAAEVPSVAPELRSAVAARYEESGGARYGISQEAFVGYVAAVVVRYGADFSPEEKLALVCGLRVEELVLARACSLGSDAAWAEFLARFRGELYRAARQIARDDTAGSDLADEFYAELYGLPNQQGRQVSKLDYYMGRGSLGGWLRTVLAQRHVDRCRSRARDVSLDEELESGIAFAAKEEPPPAVRDNQVEEAIGQTLAELSSEERFLLASYFLDRRRLAEIGRQLGTAESTICRRLKKVTLMVRKRIRKRLISSGLDVRRCDEILEELDVRDLQVDVERILRQEKKIQTF